MMMLHLAAPSALIDIGGADERTIELTDDGMLVLSALVRHVDLERSAIVAEHVPMLAQAARQIGNVRVRQRGTIGGSLAHGEPAAELPCVLIAHDASVRALGPDGARTIAVNDLPVTQLMTTLGAGELITRVAVPALTEGQGSCFMEMARRPGDFAMVDVAAIVTCDEGGTCRAVRLALGAVGRRPVDASAAAAQALTGAAIDEASTEAAGRAVAAEAEIVPSSHASAEYRREMAGVLVARALRGAAADAERRRHGERVAA
jgi:carbon-monoxide dehydrogenase medium subunit